MSAVRRLARAFIVTGGALAACTPLGPDSVATTPKGPAIEPAGTGSAQPSASTRSSGEPVTSHAATSHPARSAVPATAELNPLDAAGRHIRRAYQGQGCFVYLPFGPLKPGEQRVPGTEPPQHRLPCPPAMADAAYDACRGGVLSRQAGSCVCNSPGNPPRVFASVCPQ